VKPFTHKRKKTNTGLGAYVRLATNNIELWNAVLRDRTSHVELCTTFLLKRSVFEIHVTVKWGYNDKAPCFVYSGNTVHSTADL